MDPILFKSCNYNQHVKISSILFRGMHLIFVLIKFFRMDSTAASWFAISFVVHRDRPEI